MSDGPCEILTSGEIDRVSAPYEEQAGFGKKEASATFDERGKFLDMFIGKMDWGVEPTEREKFGSNIYVHTHPKESKEPPVLPDTLLSMSDIILAYKHRTRSCAVSTFEEKMILDCVDGSKMDPLKVNDLVTLMLEVYGPDSKGYLTPEEGEEQDRIQSEIVMKSGCRKILT